MTSALKRVKKTSGKNFNGDFLRDDSSTLHRQNQKQKVCCQIKRYCGGLRKKITEGFRHKPQFGRTLRHPMALCNSEMVLNLGRGSSNGLPFRYNGNSQETWHTVCQKLKIVLPVLTTLKNIRKLSKLYYIIFQTRKALPNFVLGL